jgi:CheY-like chemotaxis protein
MTQSSPAPRPVSVLVIEDDFDIRETICEVLEAEGLSVETAENGADALRLLRKVRPGLILLDLNMPIMSGTEFRERQSQDPSLREIPTVVLSAVDRMNERLREFSPQAAFRKPIKLSDLVSVVKRYTA